MALFNASPSSSSKPNIGRWTYEVFLSFRGEDTRNNFVGHLYEALTQRGISTFKDNEMLHRGEPISQELLKAIEESRSAVVVFSENYANSSWCLDELAKIIECRNGMGQRVLPVFYNVAPSDVRKQNGNFATAFNQHEENFMGEPEKLINWRKALVTASNISGFHFLKSDGVESEFIKNIVHSILSNIKPYTTEDDLIGIESHMDALDFLLDMKATEDVRVVGILGMGGIGKTTIAQAIFRRISYKFECSSFIKDVNNNSSSKIDTCALQIKILTDLRRMHMSVKIDDPDSGAVYIRQAFNNRKVLLVLDDVEHVKQLEPLAATHKWFGRGSRIIITTRNDHVLSDADEKYKPGLLSMDQAVELFSRHAFKKNTPQEGYERLSHRAVCYTGCLPLALKILGSFFHGRHADVWESAFDRLDKAPNIEIFATLKLSFDGLEDSEKKIFLDIACFFKGKDKEHVTRILDSFAFDPIIGISVLIEKSLITVSKKRLHMHDLIQEMGWKIARESFSNSRIWQLEDMSDLILRDKKLKVIEAIVLGDTEYDGVHYNEEPEFSTEVFLRLKNLRLLDIYSHFLTSQPTYLPYELRWVCCHDYPFSALPLANMRKLVGLEMVNSDIQHLWDGLKVLPNLKFVDLRQSPNITWFPDVSCTPYIERLILSDCTSLVEFHESLGYHRMLKYLDLSRCNELKCLPSLVEMESLETLILSHCQSLERFPEVSPCMVKLSKIYLDHCGLSLKELPSSMGYLSGLNFLNLVSCWNLENIPNSICKLKHLKSLYLHKCEKLQELPEDLGSMENLEELSLGLTDAYFDRLQPNYISIRALTRLCSLKKLDLSWRNIDQEDFPKEFNAFPLLEELYLNGNSKLIQLPSIISTLSHLKLLDLSNCRELQTLHGLPSLIQVLKARGCSSLEKIGDLSEEHEWLYKIWLLDCYKLLEDHENERYLDKILQQSFLKKCAAVNHRLSIGIPGRNVPSWFKEAQYGCNIALKLPAECHTRIMGFAVCGVFYGDWQLQYSPPRIIFEIVNDERSCGNVTEDEDSYEENTEDEDSYEENIEDEDSNKENVWITYIPFTLFQQMYHDLQPEDWAHIDGNLIMTLKRRDGDKSVRCGAHIVYREDVESIGQEKTCISDYGKLVHVNGTDDYQEDLDYDQRVSANTYVYEEKYEENNLNMMPLKSKISTRRIGHMRIAAPYLQDTPSPSTSGQGQASLEQNITDAHSAGVEFVANLQGFADPNFPD